MSKLAERITDLSLKDDLDEAIDDALRVTGGNPRAAIGALILRPAVVAGSVCRPDLGRLRAPGDPEMNGRRTGRMPEIMPSDRQRLVDLSYTIWQACSEAMRIIETRSDDYKRVSKLQADALEFGRDMAFPDDCRLRFGGPGLMSRVPDGKPRT